MNLVGFQLVSSIETFILLTATILQKASGQNYVLTSSCDGSVQTGDSCTLSCDTRNTSHSTIQWLNGSVSRPVSKSTCSPSVPFPSDYSITCPSGSSTVFTVTFTNAQFQRDTASWRCDYAFGGRGSNKVNISVEVPLTSVSLSRSSTSITCVATSSPRPSISLYRDGRSETTSPPAVEGSAGWTATLVHSLSGDRDNSLYWCVGSNSRTTVNSTTSYPEISVSSVDLTNISSPNQEVGAAESQQLTLICVTSASYPSASVTWYKNNIIITTGVSERSEVTSGAALVTTGSLTLTALSKSDLGQQVHCTATNTHTTSPVQSNTARLGVWYGPDKMNITVPSNTPAVENRDLTLTCEVTSHPKPTITWSYTDGSSPSGSVGSVTSVPVSSSRWSQTLTFRPDRNRPSLRCEARNARTAETRSTTRTLDVKYPPSGSPSITQFKSTMFEGDTGETISCSVSGGNPLADLSWSCPGTGSPSVGESGQTRASTLTFTVTRGQRGQECRCQGSWQYGGYDRSDVRSFNVNYPPGSPRLTDPGPLCEGQSITLSCSSTDPGSPAATFYWTRNNMEVYTGSRYTFTPRKDDNGTPISCAAGNAHTDRPGHFRPQSETRQLKVYYTPTVDISPDVNVTFILGQHMSLLCSAEKYPRTINFTWSFKGQASQGPVLTRVNVSRLNEGVYTCTAQPVSKEICSGNMMIAHRKANVFILQSVPPPTGLLVWSTGPDSIKLSWRVGLHLTLSLQFLVQYKEEREAWVSSPGLYNGTGQEYVQGSMNDLKPNTLYFVRVQTVTTVGWSVFSGVARILTDDRSVFTTDKSSTTTANAVLGTGIALIVVAVLGALFIFLVFRLKGQKKKTNEDKQYSSFQHQEGDTYDQLRSPTYQNTESVGTNVSPGEDH